MKWRRRFLAAGAVALGVAFVGPIAVLAERYFWVHMIQHLLVTLVAAPLIVLGAPVSELLRALTPARGRRVVRLLHSAPLRLLVHPLVTWSLFAAVMWASHFSPLYQSALENPFVHVLEHGLYLAAGLLFWTPVVGVDPFPYRLPWPGRIAYLVAALPQQSFLGLALYSADEPLYPHYVEVLHGSSLTAMEDQQIASLVMWLGGDALLLAALVLTLNAWMRYEQSDRRRSRDRLS